MVLKAVTYATAGALLLGLAVTVVGSADLLMHL